MESNMAINAEYFPTIPRSEIISTCKYTLPLSDLSAMGTGFAVAAAAITDAAMTAPSNEGLFRCIFPAGVTGQLAAFKDGSGFTGTIVNKSGIAAQARWLPAEANGTVLSIDPITLAIAVVMMTITKKMDDIQETQREILAFLHEDKESELEGIVNSLSEVMDHYRYNSENTVWLGSQLTVTSAAKVKAEQNIIFYRKQITHALEKKNWMHSGGKVNKMNKQLQHDFKYYQMCVYIFAYSSFLEILLGKNFSKAFLDHVSEKISEYSFQYRQDYSVCYAQLEQYSQTSIQAKMLEGMEKAGKFAGQTIAGIPVISKGPVDEALIAASEKLEQHNSRAVDKIMSGFRNNRDAGIQLFQESISTINQLGNQPLEVLFDKETVYICA